MVGAGPSRHTLVVATYLWASEGLSQRNLKMLSLIDKWLYSQHRPFVWAGDFNMLLDEAASSSGRLVVASPCMAATQSCDPNFSTGTNTVRVPFAALVLSVSLPTVPPNRAILGFPIMNSTLDRSCRTISVKDDSRRFGTALVL